MCSSGHPASTRLPDRQCLPGMHPRRADLLSMSIDIELQLNIAAQTALSTLSALLHECRTQKCCTVSSRTCGRFPCSLYRGHETSRSPSMLSKMSSNRRCRYSTASQHEKKTTSLAGLPGWQDLRRSAASTTSLCLQGTCSEGVCLYVSVLYADRRQTTEIVVVLLLLPEVLRFCRIDPKEEASRPASPSHRNGGEES